MVRSSKHRTLALFAVAAVFIGCIAAPASAKPWRIAVGGGRITGYLGTMAKNGIHREVLQDHELASSARLADYDMVIVSPGVANAPAVSAAVEEFVANGGVAITEVTVIPSAQAVAGQRLGPAAGPNMLFRGYDHPISAAMHSAGIMATQARSSMAIIPADGAAVTVLAEFTDEGVHQKYAGKLTGGRKHLPAMLIVEHGKGKWLYSGANIAFSLALRGVEFQPWLLASLQNLTDGEVVPRFASLPAGEWLLPSEPWISPPAQPVVRRPAQGQEASGLPDGFEAMDVPSDANSAFVLTGDIIADDVAEVLLSWFSKDWQRTIRFERDTISVIEMTNGRETVAHQVQRPPTSKALTHLLVRRRPSSVTVFLDDQPVLLAAVDTMQGEVATNGVLEAYCQPTGPVYFDDDFMRAEGETSDWETPNGTWRLHEVEGEAAQGANPFAFEATGAPLATAIVGYSFWDDYDFSCAVRGNADAVGIYAHYRAPDDCLLMRLTYPRPEQSAEVALMRLTPYQTITLASAEVDASRESWHQLRVRASRGHIIAELDGRAVAKVANDSARGAGQIGMFAEMGSALFDDVTVRPWEATPLPVGGDGPWAWEIQGARCIARDGRLMMDPNKSGQALAPLQEQTDVRASANIQVNKARVAGLLLRYAGPGDNYRLVLARGKKGLNLRLVATYKGEETTLAEAPVGIGAKEWLELTATARGELIEASINGQPVFSVSDATHTSGRVGMYCAGKGPAAFAGIEFMPLDPADVLTDPPTPPYAGIIDTHTWAGRGSGWVPRPEDPELYWHCGYFPAAVEARVGAHRAGDGRAAVSVAVGDGGELDSGYRLSADQPAAGGKLSLRIFRLGSEVATASLGGPGEAGYGVSFERTGDLLIARVDGNTVLTWRDSRPLEDMVRVGFRRDAAQIDPSDVDVVSPDVRTWTFKTAPVEWQDLTGTWDISNRWSCSPQWTWLAGWNQTGEARAMTRHSFYGDQQIDMYVGTKMMPNPNGKGHYEELRGTAGPSGWSM